MRDTKGNEFSAVKEQGNFVRNAGYNTLIYGLGIGVPAWFLGRVGETTTKVMMDACNMYYTTFTSNINPFESKEKFVEHAVWAVGSALIGASAYGIYKFRKKGQEYHQASRQEATERNKVIKAKRSIDDDLKIAQAQADAQVEGAKIENRTARKIRGIQSETQMN